MREIRCLVELRADDSRESPGRIVGTLLQYDERAGDRPELFRAGALSWPDGGIVLNEQHNRAAPILRFVPKVEGSEVLIDAPLPDTSRGRDAAVMIRNGTLRGLSVEFAATEEGMTGGVREIRRARLLAAGLVDDPSYAGSSVEVRKERSGAVRRLPWL